MCRNPRQCNNNNSVYIYMYMYIVTCILCCIYICIYLCVYGSTTTAMHYAWAFYDKKGDGPCNIRMARWADMREHRLTTNWHEMQTRLSLWRHLLKNVICVKIRAWHCNNTNSVHIYVHIHASLYICLYVCMDRLRRPCTTRYSRQDSRWTSQRERQGGTRSSRRTRYSRSAWSSPYAKINWYAAALSRK
jgi:hypothetical protein